MENALAPIEKARQVLERNRGGLVYVKTEELDTQELFRPVVTVLESTREDFHQIKGGNLMPKSHQVDRIGEASGVSFVADQSYVTKPSKYVWVGRAQGRRRMPDGTWRMSAVHEYEYDAELRAEEDCLKKPSDYPNDIAKRRHLLETAKFGRQRAGTGARLKVIRELVGMPTAFSQSQIQQGRAFVFCRIDVNSDGMLETPEGRRAALAYATGAAEELYGPQEQPRNEHIVIEEKPESHGEEPAADPPVDEIDAFALEPEVVQSALPDEKSIVRRELEEWVLSDQLSPEGVKMIKSALGNIDTPIETLKDLRNRAKTYVDRKHGST